MIVLVALMVGLAGLGVGFVLGVAYGVKREYETNQEAMYQLERWRRNHAEPDIDSVYARADQAKLDLDAADVRVRDAALGYIRADYLGTHAYTKTILCIALDHPDKYPAGQKPKFKGEGCPCGKRSGKETL